MKLHVDNEADALYVRLDDSRIVESEEVAFGVVLDFDKRREDVDIEMPQPSKRTTKFNRKGLQFQSTDAPGGGK